jgi:hypothetical protein
LFFNVDRPTLRREKNPEAAEAIMTSFESYFYLLFGPIGMFVTALMVYFLTMPRQEKRDRAPAE